MNAGNLCWRHSSCSFPPLRQLETLSFPPSPAEKVVLGPNSLAVSLDQHACPSTLSPVCLIQNDNLVAAWW